MVLSTNEDGTVTTTDEMLAYTSYGEQISLGNSSQLTKETFTGKEFDQEGQADPVVGIHNGAVGIEAYHFGLRVYDPVTGIWLSTDPVEQTWNTFGYCAGNPINLIDPNGASSETATNVGLAVLAAALYYIGNSSETGNWNIASTEWWYGTPGNQGTGVVGNLPPGFSAGYTVGMSGPASNGLYIQANGERTYPGWDRWIANGGGMTVSSRTSLPKNIDWAMAFMIMENRTQGYNAPGGLSFPGLQLDMPASYGMYAQAGANDGSDYARQYGVAGGGGISMPSFGTLWSNYPMDVNGVHQHPSSDVYALNQCAIRLSYDLINSGVDMSSYPVVNKTSEGYARSAKGLADWLWNSYEAPVRVTQANFESRYGNSTGIIYLSPPQGGIPHIDLYNGGATGSGYYLANEVWFWGIK
jgi:RHS repeat-associated protein